MMRQMMMALRTLPALLAMATAPAIAEPHWPEYRGPTTQGNVDANLPTNWSEGDNVVWKTAIPHRGWSSPVVHGNQIWMTTATEDGHELYAICVDLHTGEIVHNVQVFYQDDPQRIHDTNSHASPSPVIEDGRVHVHFGSYGTAALDTETAETIWERRDFNLDHRFGAGSSPIVYNDMLIFHGDGSDVQFIVALDKKTGETVWRRDRSVTFGNLSNNRRISFTTPVLWEIDGQIQLVSQGAEAMYGYDPGTGEELWRFNYTGYANVPRPVLGQGMLYFSTGYDRATLLALEKDQLDGQVDDAAVAWEMSRGAPFKPSFQLVDDLLYIVSDNGIAQAIDTHTGQSVWRERFGGQYSASPIYDGNHVYFFGYEGQTIVFQPGREFNEVARNELDAGLRASPAVVDDASILRTETHLFRIEER